MRFERLSVPRLPFPDLAAFNRRVHRRVDPLFARRWVRRLGIAFLALFLLVSGVWVYFASGLPSEEKLLAYQPPLPTNVRGFDGNPVQTFARERRVELSYHEYPPVVLSAFLSAEDKTFFRHGGIDYPGLMGAVVDFATKTATDGGRARGGSTITQQVAKYLLQDNEYAVSRKIREMILAFRLESALSKKEILELYLNSIFLGRNAYGVQAASRAYYDKDVSELTLPEAAYLAVLPKAPANYDPVRATERARARATMCCARWRATATSRPPSARGRRRSARHHPLRQQREVPPAGRLFHGGSPPDAARQVRREGRGRPEQRLCRRPVGTLLDGAAHAGRGRRSPSRGPCQVRRPGLERREKSIPVDGDWAGALDRAPVGTGFPDWRKAVVLSKSGARRRSASPTVRPACFRLRLHRSPRVASAGRPFASQAGHDHRRQAGRRRQLCASRSIPKIGGGFVAEEVRTGRVLAMQGGFDVIGSSYNRATQALRQPGSAFKPVVYATALENGMTPASIIVDSPFCVWQGAGLGNKCFVNFDRRYSGAKTMRWGVEQSRNLMTIRAASQIGMQKVIDNAKKMGVGEYPSYLSIALGAGDTTVLNLTNAYAILANHGREVKPTVIDYVQDRGGKVIFRSDNRCALMRNCNAAEWDGRGCRGRLRATGR